MNELLNRWRHGEVNLLQRRFRLARAQSVKPTMASKLLGNRPLPSSSSAATAVTSASTDATFVEDGSASPGSGGERLETDAKRAGEAGGAGSGRAGGAASDAAENGQLGVGGGGTVHRAGMDKEAFLRVFPDIQVRPPGELL